VHHLLVFGKKNLVIQASKARFGLLENDQEEQKKDMFQLQRGFVAFDGCGGNSSRVKGHMLLIVCFPITETSR
jgi:hypothetical protein